MFSDEQKQQILDAALEQAKNEIVQQAISNLNYSIEFEVWKEVSSIVENCASTDLKQALVEKLTSEKGAIIEAAILSGYAIAEELSKALVTSAADNLSKSYTRKKVFDALEHIPVRMISYGGSKHNISVLVDVSNKIKALKQLNEGLFS